VLISLVHLPKIPRCEHMEHKQIAWSLYFALHGISQTFMPSPCLKKGIGGVLDMNGMGLRNPFHD